MDIDEEIRRLRIAIAGAYQALEAARNGTDHDRYEAAMDVRVAEERLAWFLHDNGVE